MVGARTSTGSHHRAAAPSPRTVYGSRKGLEGNRQGWELKDTGALRSLRPLSVGLVSCYYTCGLHDLQQTRKVRDRQKLCWYKKLPFSGYFQVLYNLGFIRKKRNVASAACLHQPPQVEILQQKSHRTTFLASVPVILLAGRVPVLELVVLKQKTCANALCEGGWKAQL